MASNNNFWTESLISAAVGSLAVGAFGPGIAVAAGAVAVAAVGTLSASDIVKLYYSSLLPSVSAGGVSIARQQVEGPIQVDKSCRAPEFDYDFTNIRDDGEKHIRGNQSYERPYGSYRIALKVKDQFGDDNVWLGMKGKEAGEWPVSYHGTAKHNAQTIAEEGYKLSKSKRFLYGKGIYSTPEVAVAKLYAAEFKHQGQSYKCILQNRVNPKYLKVIPKGETGIGTYWLSNGEVDETELIRPYGICLFKE
jgi:hypothetical protein